MSRKSPKSLQRALSFERYEERLNPGTGSFSDGQFNFSVAVLFDATDAQLTTIRDRFQRGSDVLADATDGQHRFGKITILDKAGGTARLRADYWIYPEAGRAYATPGYFGLPGAHISTYFPSDFSMVNGVDGDAYTLAHEFSHHAYGVLDSYKGPQLDSAGKAKVDGAGNVLERDTVNAPTSLESATLNYTLMDNFFTRGGRGSKGDGSTYTLNEYSVPSNHDPDGDTDQSYYRRESDWTWISHSRYPATPPAGLPIDAAPASQAVNFVTVNDASEDAVRLFLVADRSGSTADFKRLDYIKGGGTAFVTGISTNQQPQVGLASFSDVATLDFGLTKLDGATPITNLRNAINNLNAAGPTNIGGGLLAALNQLPNDADASRANSIILLSDGDHNIGTDPISVLPALRAAGIVVTTIGVGNEISPAGEATLQRIARETGGSYIRVQEDSFGLLGQYNNSLAGALGNAPVSASPFTTIESDTETSFTVPVEEGAEGADFLVSLELAEGRLIRRNSVVLMDPAGNLIDPATDPSVTPIADDYLLGYRVANPMPGNWTVLVDRIANTPTRIQVQGYVDNPGTLLAAQVEGDTGTYPNALRIDATPQYRGETVLGATVNGTVLRPDGSRVPITLFDDGQLNHGDLEAGDGTYSALFNGYSPGGNGTYTFELVATVVGGVTLEGESALFPDSPSNSNTVPNFVRLGTTTAVVTGVPGTPTNADVGVDVVGPAPGVVVTQGDSFEYQIIVTNNGATPATGVFGDFRLPGSVVFGSGTATQGAVTATGGVVIFDVGDLAPGESATATVVVTPNGTGEVVTTVEVGSKDQPLTNFDDFFDSAVVTVMPGTSPPIVPPPPSGGQYPGDQNKVGDYGVGSGPGGGGTVSIRDKTGTVISTINAFSADEAPGGVRVAVADFNGDGVPDIAIGAGPGGLPVVKIYDGKTEALITTITAFESSFRGGVFVAAADLDGDRKADLIVTPDQGGGGRVRIFRGGTYDQLADFFGIDDINFRGGCRASSGDINGDGRADLIVGAGFRGGPRVAAFSGVTVPSGNAVKLFPDFFIFEQRLRNGVFVTGGDLDGDGKAEVIAGAGPNGAPRVYALSGSELLASGGTNFVARANFFAGGSTSRSGIRVAVKDFDGDNFADLLVGEGEGTGSGVTTYLGKDILDDGTPPSSGQFDAFPGLSNGVFVG